MRLALTPAPDLLALLAKIRIIHEHELGELGCMTRPPLVVLAEDVVRRLNMSAPVNFGEWPPNC